MSERSQDKGIVRSTQLDTDRIGRVLVKMTGPAFLGLFVQTMYNVVNTIFVGQYVGTDAIAGLSIVFPLQQIIVGLGTMVGIGGLSVISRSIGAGDKGQAERALGNSFTIGIGLSVIFMLVILPKADFWLRLIGASDVVLPYARTYLFIVIGGTVFGTMGGAPLNLVRAEGNAREPLISMVLGAVVSIILSAVFIGWLKMGVFGAGLATVAAQVISMLYLLSYYFRGSNYLKLRPANFALDAKVFKPIVAVGASSFMQPVANSLSGMILIHGVVAYGGDIALSAWGIFQRIFAFFTLPAMGIGQGLQPVLGFNYGARRYGLALKSIYLAIGASTVFSIAVFIIAYVFPAPMYRIFRNDPQLIEAGIRIMRFCLPALPLFGFIFVGPMVFQAIGKALQAFITAIVRPLVFLVPLLLIMSRAFELHGVYLSLPVTDVLTFTLLAILIAPIIGNLRKSTALEQKEALA